MKYYYERPETWFGAGEVIECNHPMFNRATLIQNGNKGILIIQEHFNIKTKARWWGSIEPWICYDIYNSEKFNEFFENNAKEKDSDGLYPIFKLRKIMWDLRMKPLRKEYWEEF